MAHRVHFFYHCSRLRVRFDSLNWWGFFMLQLLLRPTRFSAKIRSFIVFGRMNGFSTEFKKLYCQYSYDRWKHSIKIVIFLPLSSFKLHSISVHSNRINCLWFAFFPHNNHKKFIKTVSAAYFFSHNQLTVVAFEMLRSGCDLG